jgi:hypothetical protein
MRLNTDAEVYQALDSVLDGKLRAYISEWADVADELIAQYGPSTGSVVIDIPTEPVAAAPMAPGDTVRRTGVSGWRGVIVAIESAPQALIHWYGDPAPSLASLNGLEMAV